LREVHAPHAILEGQFARRLEILRSTLQAAGLPGAVIAHWVAHTERLRPVVLGTDAECQP
jgi:hypothetical protein